MNIWELTESLSTSDREAAERAMCEGVESWATKRLATLYPRLIEYTERAGEFPQPYNKLAAKVEDEITELTELIQNAEARRDVLYCQLRDRLRK